MTSFKNGSGRSVHSLRPKHNLEGIKKLHNSITSHVPHLKHAQVLPEKLIRGSDDLPLRLEQTDFAASSLVCSVQHVFVCIVYTNFAAFKKK